MSNEPIELVAAGYEWICTECDTENSEPTIPVIGTSLGEVKCKSCSTTFDCTGAEHAYSR